ncbi:MAG: heterodisulfide reductase subunit A, partial [Fervidicoccus fontis]
MDKKIGVYICSGCEIGDAVDIEKLVEIAKEKGVSVVKTSANVCGPTFIEEIKNDIANEGINTVVIAACSPRVKTDIFNFPGCIVERVNIREFVAWVMEPKSDDAQMAAQDYLRMGIVKAEKTNLPEPWIGEDLSEEILVVGGGTSGLSAAIESSKAGFKVTVIEKEDKLGGWAAKWYKTTPTKYPFTSLEEPAVFKMIKDVESDPNITVLLNTKIVKTEGMPGL